MSTANLCHLRINSSFVNDLVYVASSDAAKDDAPDYRMYWSTIGAPTFLVNEVPKGTSEDYNGIAWMEYLLSGGKPRTPYLTLPRGRYVAMTFMNIMEFDDEAGTGEIENAKNISVHHFEDANWYNVLIATVESSLLAVFTGSIPGAFGGKNITIEVKTYPRDTRDSDPPKLLVSSGSTTVRIILDQASVRWKNRDFALEVIYTSNDSSNQTSVHNIVQTGTDRFSPGSFAVECTSGTGMEWRPVVYTAAGSGETAFTRSSTGPFADISVDFSHNVTEGGVPYILLLGLTGAAHLTHFNISFGQPNDGYYNSTKFQEWSCQIGIGQPQYDPNDPVNPPSDGSRTGMYVGIGCGVGAAVLVAAVLSYFAYRKVQKRRKDGTLLVSRTTTTYETLERE